MVKNSYIQQRIYSCRLWWNPQKDLKPTFLFVSIWHTYVYALEFPILSLLCPVLCLLTPLMHKYRWCGIAHRQFLQYIIRSTIQYPSWFEILIIYTHTHSDTIRTRYICAHIRIIILFGYHINSCCYIQCV